jgi:hypothetical protein
MFELLDEVATMQSQRSDNEVVALTELQLLLIGGGGGAASLD